MHLSIFQIYVFVGLIHSEHTILSLGDESLCCASFLTRFWCVSYACSKHQQAAEDELWL